jgi:hypothetical protein
MHKDKWNCKNPFNHKVSGHNTFHWDMFGKEQDTIHLLKQFNEECFNTIGVFQIERIVNWCNQMFHMFFNVFTWKHFKYIMETCEKN